jgi:TrmH family RNA methyltransferase
MGRHNPRLSQVRIALHKGELTPDGLLAVEGANLVDEVEKSGIEILELFLREGEVSSASAGQRHVLSATVFHSVSATRSPQGVIALVRPPKFTLESMLRQETLSLIVLCRLQDPGNVGNIFRIGEAFEATGCITTEGTVSLYNGKVVRASAGSLFRLPHVEGVRFQELAKLLRSRSIQIVGTAMDAEGSLSSIDWQKPSAILFGNEGAGLGQEERRACDRIVRIPHARSVDSLNAATAGGIVLYEVARCRNPEAI